MFKLFKLNNLCHFCCLNSQKCWRLTVCYNVASRINILGIRSRLLCASQVPEVKCNVTNSGTETWTESDVKVKKRRKRSQIEKYSLENVDSLVSSNGSGENVKDIIELALSEKDKGTYLIDETVAKHLIDLLITDLKKDDSLVLEANPGLGILTKELLKAGVNRLSLCETSLHFFNYLKNCNFPQEKVKIFNKDIIRFWKLQFLDKTDGGERMSSIFSGISQRSWEDEPVVKVITIIPNKKFICNVIDNVITRTGFVKFGRPEFFVVIDPISYSALINKGKQGYRTYRPNSVLFQMIFNYEILTRIPNSALVPPIKINKSLTPIEKKVLEKEGDSMYVVKLTPRKGLFLDEFDKYLPTFHYFLKQLFSARSNRIIPFLEHWVPGCGPRLIAKGLTIYTEVGEVEPKEIHNIFLEFIWGDKNSGNSFYASMDSYMLKKEDSDLCT